MLTEKEINKNNLSAVTKSSAKIIRLKKAVKTSFNLQKKEKPALLPPRNQFNSGYIKAKENDPL